MVSNHKTYLKYFFASKIYEHFCIQVSKWNYDMMKRTKGIITMKVKDEKGCDDDDDDDDMVSQISKYIETKFTHFYTTSIDGKEVQMLEMHTDDLYSYCKLDDEQNLPMIGPHGGLLSIRTLCGKKPRLVFGQDEAIFCSYQFNESCWTVDGETSLWVKGLGVGIMVSVFVSCTFGFGLDVTKEDLAKINQLQLNKKYADEEAATYINGNNTKRDLIKSPFV